MFYYSDRLQEMLKNEECSDEIILSEFALILQSESLNISRKKYHLLLEERRNLRKRLSLYGGGQASSKKDTKTWLPEERKLNSLSQ